MNDLRLDLAAACRPFEPAGQQARDDGTINYGNIEDILLRT
jgi:hypothetical protein